MAAFRVDWMPFAGLRQSGHGVGGIHPARHADRDDDDALGGALAARQRLVEQGAGVRGEIELERRGVS